MHAVASIRNLWDGAKKLVLIEELKDDVKIQVRFFEKWDMSIMQPIKSRPQLSKEQNDLLISVLQTNEGKRLLNNLKNSKSNLIINQFLGNIKKEIPEHHKDSKGIVTGKTKLYSFFESMINEPLIGINHTKEKSVGLTKWEIWQECLKQKLIVKA